MIDKNDFGKLMCMLGEVFDKQITELLADIYYKIFKDYDYSQTESAFYKVIRSNKYATLPKPAEMLEYLEGTRDDKTLAAWLQVMEAVRKGGYHASIEFADPIIPHCVNDLGGWMWFCCTEKVELPFIQKRFEDLYRLYLKRELQVDNVRLIGFHEAQNSQKGKEIAPAIRIGFIEIPGQIEER